MNEKLLFYKATKSGEMKAASPLFIHSFIHYI